MKAQRLNTVVRDFGSTLLGFAILVHQTVIAEEPHALLILAALTLLGVPGASGLLALWLNGKSNGGGTPGSGSPSRPLPPSRRSSTSSRKGKQNDGDEERNERRISRSSST